MTPAQDVQIILFAFLGGMLLLGALAALRDWRAALRDMRQQLPTGRQQHRARDVGEPLAGDEGQGRGAAALPPRPYPPVTRLTNVPALFTGRGAWRPLVAAGPRWTRRDPGEAPTIEGGEDREEED